MLRGDVYKKPTNWMIFSLAAARRTHRVGEVTIYQRAGSK